MQETPSPEGKKETTRRMLPPAAKGAPSLPENLRWPLEGKTETPTVPPKRTKERQAEMVSKENPAISPRFLFTVVLGQGLVIGSIFGGEAWLRWDYVLPYRFVLFLAFACGTIPLGLFLLVQKGGGVVRSFLTFLILTGTAAAAVPSHEWGPQAKYVWEWAKHLTVR
jgi:hypothetical protein